MGYEANKRDPRTIGISEPQLEDLKREKTLYVTGLANNWPLSVAAYVLVRMALENGCTKIDMTSRSGKHWSFDTLALLQHCRQLNPVGYLPQIPQGRYPKRLATLNAKRHGAIETWKPHIYVPAHCVPKTNKELGL